MQEMLYPTSYLKSRHLGAACALVTDGRFSGGTSGLSIGHVSPEAASGGAISLIQDGDTIDINIPERTINLMVSAEELASRRQAEEARGAAAFTPGRERVGQAVFDQVALTPGGLHTCARAGGAKILTGLCTFCGFSGQGGGAGVG